MSKRSLLLTSLVAAIPAGILLALIVTSLLGSFENLTLALHVVIWSLLVMCTLVVLLPLGIALEVAGLGYGGVPAGAPARAPIQDDDDVSSPSSSADDDDEMTFEDDDDGFEDDDDDDGFDDFEDDDDDDWA